MLKVILLTLFFSLSAHSAPRAYFEMGKGFWSEPKLMIDGKPYTVNFWGYYSGADNAFQADPKAHKLMQAHLENQKWGSYFLWGGLGAALIYGASASEYNSGTYWGIFSLGLIPAIYFHTISSKQLVRAINQYNGVYGKGDVSLHVGPNALGLAWTF